MRFVKNLFTFFVKKLSSTFSYLFLRAHHFHFEIFLISRSIEKSAHCADFSIDSLYEQNLLRHSNHCYFALWIFGAKFLVAG
jgi:hypothetical protein